MEKQEEVMHENYIRYPYCGYQDKISDWDCDYAEEKYEEGEHEVSCSKCNKSFTFVTRVDYCYFSPPMISEESEGESNE